jgi:hypothetical protein
MFYCDLDDLDDWADALSNAPWPNLGSSPVSSGNNGDACFFETEESLKKKRSILIKERNSLSVYKAKQIIELNDKIKEIEDQLTKF